MAFLGEIFRIMLRAHTGSNNLLKKFLVWKQSFGKFEKSFIPWRIAQFLRLAAFAQLRMLLRSFQTQPTRTLRQLSFVAMVRPQSSPAWQQVWNPRKMNFIDCRHHFGSLITAGVRKLRKSFNSSLELHRCIDNTLPRRKLSVYCESSENGWKTRASMYSGKVSF